MIEGKNVLVTGGAGFVGSHLVDALLKLGNQVTVFDLADLPSVRNLDLAQEIAKSNGRFRYIQGDIRSREDVGRAFDQPYSHVFHLASIVGIHKYIDDPFGLIDITVGGTRNIAEFVMKSGARLLYTSTSEVFGKNPKVPWDEDDDRVVGSTNVDRWSYSSSKAVCEHMLLALYRQKKVPLSIVRYFNVYGPRQNPIFVVSQSVYKALNGEPPLLYDGGEQTRCFTYVEDAIRGTLLAASRPEAIGEVFNIGNDKEISMKEAVELVLKGVGNSALQWQALDTEKHYGKTYEDIPRRVPANAKAKRLLGWEPTTSHEAGIFATVEWARKHSWYLAPRSGQ